MRRWWVLAGCILAAPAWLSAQEPITFTAADSLHFRVKGHRLARLFGNAKVVHPSGTLSAGQIVLDLDATEMEATTAVPGDTLSEPVLERGDDRIRSRRIRYNYTTEKGKFEVTRVSIEEGRVRGEQVKRTAPHVVFIQDGRYSTCEYDHPHFYIRASRMKIVDEEEVFFTNARLYILDIPYPIPFPFGYIPSGLKRQRSGLLEPIYAFQDQNSRGLGIQNVGWYQYVNDHLTTTLSADLFTSGSRYFQNQTEYASTDRFRGSLNLGYSVDQGMERTDPDFTRSIQQSLRWSHNQTINPYASFNMNINLRTAQYFRRNSYDIDERAQTSTSSTLGYTFRQPDGLYTFGASLSQSQDFKNNTVNMQGPNTTFSLKRLTPFQPRNRIGTPKFYQTLSIGYNNRFSSRFDFRPLATADPGISWVDALFDPSAYRQASGRQGHVDYGAQHQVDATMQLWPGDYVNLTGGFRLTEYWYGETTRRTFNPDSNRVYESRVREFATARDFSGSLTLGTTLYGIGTGRIGNLEGFRHTLRPSLNYTWRPDFSDPKWGWYRTVPTDTLGNTTRYSIFQNNVFGGPGAGQVSAVSFTLGNVFETKQVRRDSTGEKRERIVRLIDNLSASMGYNFAATAFKLSDLTTNLSSNVVQGWTINASAGFTPYQIDTLGVRLPKYRWDAGRSPLALTRLTLGIGTRFSAGQTGIIAENVPASDFPATYDPLDQHEFHGYDEIFQSTVFQPLDVAWSASFNLNYGWTRNGRERITRTAILNAQNIQVRLTREWRFNTQLGYDFIQERFTPGQFAVSRQLHCWDMSFVWSPFGDFQFYLFRLTVRNSRLQTLFQKLPVLNNLERRNSPINRF